MSRLIDADKLMRHLSDWALYDAAPEIRECMKAVEEQPTVDPVKHGHWDECVAIFYDVTSTIASVENKSMAFTPEIRKTIYRCSCCGLSNMSMTDFCQNCGAKMDKNSLDSLCDEAIHEFI